MTKPKAPGPRVVEVIEQSGFADDLVVIAVKPKDWTTMNDEMYLTLDADVATTLMNALEWWKDER